MKAKNLLITPELIATNANIEAEPELIAKNIIDRAADELCSITPLNGCAVALICRAVHFAIQNDPANFPVQLACDALTRFVELNTNVTHAENSLFVFSNVCAELSALNV